MKKTNVRGLFGECCIRKPPCPNMGKGVTSSIELNPYFKLATSKKN